MQAISEMDQFYLAESLPKRQVISRDYQRVINTLDRLSLAELNQLAQEVSSFLSDTDLSKLIEHIRTVQVAREDDRILASRM